jgi:hypothetical protein
MHTFRLQKCSLEKSNFFFQFFPFSHSPSKNRRKPQSQKSSGIPFSILLCTPHPPFPLYIFHSGSFSVFSPSFPRHRGFLRFETWSKTKKETEKITKTRKAGFSKPRGRLLLSFASLK